jgi:hypothetical protein
MTPLALIDHPIACRGVPPRTRRAAARDTDVPIPIRVVDGCAREQDKLIRPRAQRDRLLALRRRIEHLRRLLVQDREALGRETEAAHGQ